MNERSYEHFNETIIFSNSWNGVLRRILLAVFISNILSFQFLSHPIQAHGRDDGRVVPYARVSS